MGTVRRGNSFGCLPEVIIAAGEAETEPLTNATALQGLLLTTRSWAVTRSNTMCCIDAYVRVRIKIYLNIHHRHRVAIRLWET